MTGTRFPALSVRQPWAELLVSGRKAIEIRSWVSDYRGRIWIHAGKHVDAELDARLGILEPFRGGFVGSVELTSIESFDLESWHAWRHYHLDSGQFNAGLFAWILSNPRRLQEPVPSTGNLKLYSVDTNTHSRLVSLDAAVADGGQYISK